MKGTTYIIGLASSILFTAACSSSGGQCSGSNCNVIDLSVNDTGSLFDFSGADRTRMDFTFVDAQATTNCLNKLDDTPCIATPIKATCKDAEKVTAAVVVTCGTGTCQNGKCEARKEVACNGWACESNVNGAFCSTKRVNNASCYWNDQCLTGVCTNDPELSPGDKCGPYPKTPKGTCGVAIENKKAALGETCCEFTSCETGGCNSGKCVNCAGKAHCDLDALAMTEQGMPPATPICN